MAILSSLRSVDPDCSIRAQEWHDHFHAKLLYIGKIRVIREEGKAYVSAITVEGGRQQRKVKSECGQK